MGHIVGQSREHRELSRKCFCGSHADLGTRLGGVLKIRLAHDSGARNVADGEGRKTFFVREA